MRFLILYPDYCTKVNKNRHWASALACPLFVPDPLPGDFNREMVLNLILERGFILRLPCA